MLRCAASPARLNAALRPCFAGFNRVNHCGVPMSTPHFSGFARLASEAFYFAIPILSFYDFIKFEDTKDMITAHAVLALFREFVIGLGLMKALDKSIPVPGADRLHRFIRK